MAMTRRTAETSTLIGAVVLGGLAGFGIRAARRPGLSGRRPQRAAPGGNTFKPDAEHHCSLTGCITSHE